MWLAGSLGFLVVLAGIALSLIPPGEATNKWLFEAELIGCILGSRVAFGLVLYYRGARAKARRESSEVRALEQTSRSSSRATRASAFSKPSSMPASSQWRWIVLRRHAG